MSEYGRVIHVPTGVHRCVVTIGYTDRGAGTLPFDHPAYYAQPGTVIECTCGRTFVAQERRLGEGFPRWSPEGWLARRRRRRAVEATE